MTSNPYLAPSAVVGDVSLAEPAPPRPRAVVVTLVFGWILVALFSFAMAKFTVNFVLYWNVLSHAAWAYLQIAVRAALAFATLSMVVGLHKRWRIGRWLGALFILSIKGFLIFAILATPPMSEDFYYRLGGYLGGSLVLCAPVAWWFYAFTLSRKARIWFKWSPGPDALR